MDKHFGWICPKCGTSNSPNNKVCEHCSSTMTPFNPNIGPFDPLKPYQQFKPYTYNCAVCGLDMSGPMGYVCQRLDCPGGVVYCTTNSETK